MEHQDKPNFVNNVIVNIQSPRSNHLSNNRNPNAFSQVEMQQKPSALKPSSVESSGSRNNKFSKNTNENNGDKNWKILDLIEWLSFLTLLGLFIASLSTDNLTLFEVDGWRYAILIIVIVCGNIVTKLLANSLTFLIEKANNFLKSDILYILYVLIKSSRALIWLGLIIHSWLLLIKGQFEKSSRSDDEQRVLNKITRAMACTLVGTSLWMLKSFLVKLLASSFQLRTFFDRVRDAIFFQYVFRQFSGGNEVDFKEWERVEKLFDLKRENVSAFFMTQLIEMINVQGLTEKRWTEYENEAKFEASKMLKNIANEGNRYIDEDDLGRFLPKAAIEKLVKVIGEGGTEDVANSMETSTTNENTKTTQIEKSSFEMWMFDAYKELKCLAYSLNDSNTSIDEFTKICSTIALILIVIVWLLLMGITTTEVLIFISSQLLTWGFVFSNTLQSIFQGIIFNFILHPFDVADRCVIDGIEMVVEEMSLLSTTFLRNESERIHYSNSVLAPMRISNFNRSSKMNEIVEFVVDFSTPAQSLSTLKMQLTRYLESEPQHWLKDHTLQIKEADDESKEMKMFLNVTHTTYVQTLERKNKRFDLVLQLTKILDGVSIKYQILPQSGSA